MPDVEDLDGLSADAQEQNAVIADSQAILGAGRLELDHVASPGF